MDRRAEYLTDVIDLGGGERADLFAGEVRQQGLQYVRHRPHGKVPPAFLAGGPELRAAFVQIQ